MLNQNVFNYIVGSNPIFSFGYIDWILIKYLIDNFNTLKKSLTILKTIKHKIPKILAKIVILNIFELYNITKIFKNLPLCEC